MLEWLDTHISLQTLFWLFPVTFLLHDFEEIIFVESWFKKNYERLRDKVPMGMKDVFEDLAKTTSARFSIPVLLQLIFYVIAAFLAAETGFYGAIIGFNVLLFLHVFMHVGQSVFFRTYALGVGSAVLITLPYSIYFFYRVLDEELADFSDLLINLPFGILTVLVVFGGHKLAPRLLPD